jgi:hypothetical protein
MGTFWVAAKDSISAIRVKGSAAKVARVDAGRDVMCACSAWARSVV